jgi:uncharacterized repeat protein (TIGR01451 family)
VFTNTRQTGEVTFVKGVDGGTADPSEWTFDVEGPETVNDIPHNGTETLDTGSYTVTEDGGAQNNADYYLTGASGLCVLEADGSVSMEVGVAGGSCTMTNTRKTFLLSLIKSLDGNADEDGSLDVSAGDTLTYRFVATNIGNQILHNVTISDTLPGLSDLDCTPGQPAILAPSDTLECTATYVVTAADVEAGEINNTATADSDETDPVTDPETVPVPNPALSLDKSLDSNADEDESGDVSLGDTLTYRFVATNAGTANLTNVTITDPLPGLSALSCAPGQPASLTPSETLECTATYVVTEADVEAGEINNTATADSDQTDPVDDPETVLIAIPVGGATLPLSLAALLGSWLRWLALLLLGGGVVVWRPGTRK